MELLLSSIVVTGEGFTPQLVTAKALRSVFPDEPTQAVATPIFALLEYDGRYQVLVQEGRIEVKRDKPPPGEDVLMQRAIGHLLTLWPLVEPQAVGVNVLLSEAYADDGGQERLTEHLTHQEWVESVLDARLLGSSHSFIVQVDDARTTIKVDTAARIDDRSVALVHLNAHYQPIDDPARVIESQRTWHERAAAWAERIFHDT